MMVRGNGGTGYIRMDWFTPDGLPTWGDGRLTILGTDGYIELRKYVDIAGRPGGNHLFLVDQKGMHYIDCSDVELPYGRQLVDDVLNRTETAMPQAHCFLATELAIRAQEKATDAEAWPASRLSQLGSPESRGQSRATLTPFYSERRRTRGTLHFGRRTHEWVDGKPPTHSWSLGFVKCAPPAPRPLPLAIPRRASSLSSCLCQRRPPFVRGGPFLRSFVPARRSASCFTFASNCVCCSGVSTVRISARSRCISASSFCRSAAVRPHAAFIATVSCFSRRPHLLHRRSTPVTLSIQSCTSADLLHPRLFGAAELDATKKADHVHSRIARPSADEPELPARHVCACANEPSVRSEMMAIPMT